MRTRWLLVGILAAICSLVAAPAASATTAAATSVPRADAVALTVTGADGAVKTYTLDQLKSGFTAYVGYAGYVKSGFVAMQAPRPVKGVLLTDLLKKVGYDSATNVTVGALDGYKQLLSADMVAGTGLTVYQATPPSYPQVVPPADNPVSPLIAYQEKAVAGATTTDANPWVDYSTYATAGWEADGPLRLWYAYPTYIDPGFVTVASGCIRMADKVTVEAPVTPDWQVTLKGPGRAFALTKTQLKDWVAETSYGETTVKVAGHTYSGLPLYIAIGTVDDAKKTSFNVKKARKGYTIVLRSSSRKVSISSKLIAGRTRKIILAWKKDGVTLSGSAAPLCLVGTPLKKAQQISGLKTITLRGL